MEGSRAGGGESPLRRERDLQGARLRQESEKGKETGAEMQQRSVGWAGEKRQRWIIFQDLARAGSTWRRIGLCLPQGLPEKML